MILRQIPVLLNKTELESEKLTLHVYRRCFCMVLYQSYYLSILHFTCMNGESGLTDGLKDLDAESGQFYFR